MGQLFCFLFCTSYTKDQLTTGNGRRAPPASADVLGVQPWDLGKGMWVGSCTNSPGTCCFQSTDFRPCTVPHSTHSAHFAAGTLKALLPHSRRYSEPPPQTELALSSSHRPFLRPTNQEGNLTLLTGGFCWKLTPVAGDLLLCTWILK